MTDTDSWLDRYADNHRNLTWPLIYWAAVPAVIVGTVGVLWSLPIPEEFFAISPLLNWGSAFLMAAAVYYFIISLSIAIGLLPFMLGLAAIHLWLQQSTFSPLRVSIGLLAKSAVPKAMLSSLPTPSTCLVKLVVNPSPLTTVVPTSGSTQ